jgi:hypothetical protein
MTAMFLANNAAEGISIQFDFQSVTTKDAHSAISIVGLASLLFQSAIVCF